MERRVIGMILVLLAMALTAVSVGTRAWWKGSLGSRELSIGTFAEEMCRTRSYGELAGQRSCEVRIFNPDRGREVQAFMLTGFGVTFLAGLANMFLLATAIAAGTRKALPLGWVGLAFSVLFLGSVIAFVGQVPEVVSRLGAGFGMYFGFAGAILGAVGSVIVATSRAAPSPTPTGAMPAGFAPPPAGGYGAPPTGGFGAPPSNPGYPGAPPSNPGYPGGYGGPPGAPPGYGPPGGGYPGGGGGYPGGGQQ